MDKLYGWEVCRSGSALTVTHSTGKVTGVTAVRTENGKVVALGGGGRRYELVVAAAGEEG